MPDNYNIWNMYGLKDNPFNSDPLSPYGRDLPIDKTFLGRETEVEKIKRLIYSNKSTRILVYGDVGVGKTTFVNYIKHDASKHGYFTPLGELSIQYEWTAEQFMFNTISTIYVTIDRTDKVKEKINKNFLNKLDIIFGHERGASIGGGISILGSGGNIEKSKSYGVPHLNATTLKILLQDTIDELMRIGFKGVILHYNNLELIQEKGDNEEKGEKQLKRILNGLRDFLQVNGAHFIFVSDKKLYEMFQQLPRVEDIFKVPILIKPFDFKEINAIINKRIELLRIQNVNPIIPFEDETLEMLFKLYLGNLRGILRGLDCAITETVSSRPVLISPLILKTSLFKFAKNRFLGNFNKEDGNTLKILRRILEKRETTNKLLSEHFKMLPQNVSASLTQLREAGAIKLAKEEGRSRYYVPSQEALWLLLEPTPEWETAKPF